MKRSWRLASFLWACAAGQAAGSAAGRASNAALGLSTWPHRESQPSMTFQARGPGEPTAREMRGHDRDKKEGIGCCGIAWSTEVRGGSRRYGEGTVGIPGEKRRYGQRGRQLSAVVTKKRFLLFHDWFASRCCRSALLLVLRV